MEKVKVISNVSIRLNGRPGLIEYGNKLKELSDVASVISPDGGLYVNLIEKSESFEPINEVLRNVSSINSIFSQKDMQRNPEIITDYQEILAAVNKINKLVRKRKDSLRKRRDANKQKKEETK